MKGRLLIRLLADQEAVQWGLLNEQEATPSFLERGDLLLNDIVALAEMAVTSPVTVLIPAEKIRSFVIDAPTKNSKHLEKAIPYLLEEQIIESVDSQHFAFGEVDSNSKVTVNVIAKDYLESLLAKLQEADIEPDVMLADAACLPVFDDAWSLLDGNPVLVRQDLNNFWSAQSELVADLLNWNLNESFEETQAISQAVRLFSAQEVPLNLESMPGLAVQQVPLDDELLWLAGQPLDKTINLLQQQYTPSKKTSVSATTWKLPLIAASVAAVLGLIYFTSNLFILNQERNHYRQLALTEVRKLSPNLDEERLDSKMIEIANNYRKVAAGSGQTGGFMNLLDQVYNQLNPRQVQLEQMEYIAKQSVLNLDVAAKDYQILTAVQQKLEQAGLKVDMRNARDNQGSWTTRLVVKAK